MQFIEEIPRRCMYCREKCEYIVLFTKGTILPSIELRTVCGKHKDEYLRKWGWNIIKKINVKEVIE